MISPSPLSPPVKGGEDQYPFPLPFAGEGRAKGGVRGKVQIQVLLERHTVMLNALKFILLLSIVIWVGMLVFFTFIVTPAVFQALPRETAGDVVARIFPWYWAVGYVAGILSLSSLLAISFVEKGFPAARIILLALMTAFTFYSGMVVWPEAKAVKAQMAEVKGKDQARYEELRGEFKRIHMESYALNIAVTAAGLVFVFFTSRNMRL